MLVLRLVNIKKKYWFYEEYNTIGEGIKRLNSLTHSNRITCIDMYDTNETPLPPQLWEAFHKQRFCADDMMVFGEYPLYIKIEKGE